MNLHKYDKALEDAKKCLEINPDFVKGYLRLGNALVELKDFEEAMEQFDIIR